LNFNEGEHQREWGIFEGENLCWLVRQKIKWDLLTVENEQLKDCTSIFIWMKSENKSTQKINLVHAPVFGTDPEAKILSHCREISILHPCPMKPCETKRLVMFRYTGGFIEIRAYSREQILSHNFDIIGTLPGNGF
jgi:hypothetical protein